MHVNALIEAESLVFHSDFCPYLELKALLADGSPAARHRFRILYVSFYGLNVGGLTDEFKDRYFNLMFDGQVVLNGIPQYSTLLTELSLMRRRKGDFAMPFSFVSKLVAMHRDQCPIYDRHVLAFFEEQSPAAEDSKSKRVAWFERFLGRVATSYADWARDSRLIATIERFKARDERLALCNEVRLVDFLVWKVGNQRLLKPR